MLVNIETLSSDNKGNVENTNPSLLIETKNSVIYNSTLRNMNRFVINFMRLLYKDGYITKESKEKLYREFERYLGHHPNQQHYRDFQKIALSTDPDLNELEVCNRYLAYKFLVASFLKDEVLNEIEKHLNIDKSNYDRVRILMADCANNDIKSNLYESFPTCRFYGFLGNEKGEVEMLPSIVPDDFEMTGMQRVLSLTDLRPILVDRVLYVTAGRIFIMNNDGKTLAKIC